MLRLLVFYVCLTLLTPLPSSANDEQPNVIVILADDQGWGDLSLTGSNLVQTPHIDRLGHEGAQLPNFYASANVCTPSRAGLLTGRYPIRARSQHVVFPHHDWGMPNEEITIAELLRGAGYRTGMVGKWHLGHRREFWPTAQGFEVFTGVPYSNDMVPFDLYRNERMIQSEVPQEALTDIYTDAAIEFITADDNRPFFLYFAHTFPHLPLHVPDDRAFTSEGGLYGDVIEHIDASVGALLSALDEAGLDDNTLVIFTSDNGPWFEGSAGHLRDRKGGTHEGSFRVPFLARWPLGIKPGTVSSAMAMNIDLLPTIAALAGASLPEDRVIDGRDIQGLLKGEEISPHDVLLFTNGNDIVGIRDNRFKLQTHTYYKSFYVPFEQFGSVQLFDLLKDPSETVSYVREYPEDVARLKAQMEAYRKEFAQFRWPVPSLRPDAEEAKRLGPQFGTADDNP